MKGDETCFSVLEESVILGSTARRDVMGYIKILKIIKTCDKDKQ